MRINNNMMAMNTHRQLGNTNAMGAKSMERLSSGFRINRAGDDAAGLAISEKMRAQIRGLNQASRNAQDGISLIQTAEGSLGETQSILQRMRELAVQAASDTNVDADRQEIQKEMNQLTSEIDRIANTTEFNTQKLLNGGPGVSGAVGTVSTPTAYDAGSPAVAASLTLDGALTITAASGGTAGNAYTVNVVQGDAATFGSNTESAIVVDGDGNVTITLGQSWVGDEGTGSSVANTLTADQIAALSPGGDGAALISLSVVEGQGGEDISIAGSANLTGGEAAVGETAAIFSFSVTANFAEGETITIGTETFTFGSGTGEVEVGENINATVTNLRTVITAGTTYNAGGSDATITLTQKTAASGDAPAVSVAGAAGSDSYTATLQIGANTAQSFAINVSDMRAEALKISGTAGAEITARDGSTTATLNTDGYLDVSSYDSATNAITFINDAIESVSAERSKLGAFQNRLESTIRNLDSSAENIQASESRIRDVDMAKEMMEFTKQNILQQAATAMLAQANQAPQAVLQLLR